MALGLIGVYRALGGGWEIREGGDVVSDEVKAEMARRTNWGRLLETAQPHAEGLARGGTVNRRRIAVGCALALAAALPVGVPKAAPRPERAGRARGDGPAIRSRSR